MTIIFLSKDIFTFSIDVFAFKTLEYHKIASVQQRL